jgi:hypothetical protein
MKSAGSILCLMLSALCGWSQSVTLTWIPSASTNVTAYKIYGWTNCPDANCFATNAVQTVETGNVTNATIAALIAANYTFKASALATITNADGGTNADGSVVPPSISESSMSNPAHWFVPPAPQSLMVLQESSDLIIWNQASNAQGKAIFFRLVTTNAPP